MSTFTAVINKEENLYVAEGSTCDHTGEGYFFCSFPPGGPGGQNWPRCVRTLGKFRIYNDNLTIDIHSGFSFVNEFIFGVDEDCEDCTGNCVAADPEEVAAEYSALPAGREHSLFMEEEAEDTFEYTCKPGLDYEAEVGYVSMNWLASSGDKFKMTPEYDY